LGNCADHEPMTTKNRVPVDVLVNDLDEGPEGYEPSEEVGASAGAILVIHGFHRRVVPTPKETISA
jgi:hypothetical protein